MNIRRWGWFTALDDGAETSADDAVIVEEKSLLRGIKARVRTHSGQQKRDVLASHGFVGPFNPAEDHGLAILATGRGGNVADTDRGVLVRPTFQYADGAVSGPKLIGYGAELNEPIPVHSRDRYDESFHIGH
ncbi:hypothetical protein SFOMI_2303 [Sphingobium fuliginis]|uniref:Uncharacterized protein n=1 Tax=Sphingobium fuliginis (strain ATCC 27551) TaxID=336203 RepID=A0A292ZFV2_SPHSA|nr:hypothetical protein SFOMI_2303 [Sphingobium fuliginis]